MRTTSIFPILSLLSLGHTLPYAPQLDAQSEALVRRAKYSVVPVDGGPPPAATGEDGTDPSRATILRTIIQTAPQATKTILDTPAPTTKYVTVTQSPTTVTATGYSIINVFPPQIPVKTSELLPSTTSSIRPSGPAISSTASLPSSESLLSSTTTYLSLPSDISVTPSVTFSTTTTYDDGQWHTTYPSWSNRTQNRDNGAWKRANPTPLPL